MTPADAQIAQTWWDKYGLLGLGIVVFASVIAYLFKLLIGSMNKRVEQCDRENTDHATQRGKWDTERETWNTQLAEVRADYEQKHRELEQRLGREIREIFVAQQQREDQVRREFADLMETVTDRYSKSSDANTAVLQKFYDRFVGPRSRKF